MDRRVFVLCLGATIVRPPAASAQQTNQVRRVGVLMPYADDPVAQARLSLFRQGLEAQGWVDGRNVRIDYYFANSDFGRMRNYAAKLVASEPDVIFAASPPVLAALKQQTKSVPIVFTNITDPVGVGIVQTLSHPGGNITGFGAYEFSIAGKWVELLKEIAPSLLRIGAVMMPQHATDAKLFQSAQTVATAMKLELIDASVRNSEDIERVMAEAAKMSDTGLMVLPSPATTDHHALIVQLAMRYKLPAIFPYRDLAEGGGLMSYGPNVSEDYKSAALYVDRILKGERPADLPVQAPAKFELMINLKTAKAIGLAISPQLLAQADQVIE